MLRNLPAGSAEAERIRPFMERAQLVPDEVVVEIWQGQMRRRVESGDYDPQRQILLLDGIPRTPPQAGMLDQIIEIKRVIYLACEDESELVQRLLQRGQAHGRSDDADESVIRRRIALHRREVLPVLEHYPHRISHIDACQDALRVLI